MSKRYSKELRKYKRRNPLVSFSEDTIIRGVTFLTVMGFVILLFGSALPCNSG